MRNELRKEKAHLQLSVVFSKGDNIHFPVFWTTMNRIIILIYLDFLYAGILLCVYLHYINIEKRIQLHADVRCNYFINCKSD